MSRGLGRVQRAVLAALAADEPSGTHTPDDLATRDAQAFAAAFACNNGFVYSRRGADGRQGWTTADLSYELGVDHSSVARAVRRLEAAGAVEVARHRWYGVCWNVVTLPRGERAAAPL